MLLFACSQQQEKCVQDYNLAKQQVDSGKYATAIPMLKTHIEKCKSDSALFQLSFCYSRLLEWDSAIYYAEKTLEVNPNNTLALSNLASLYSLNDSTCARALLLMLRLDSLKPSFDYQITLAKIYGNLKKYSKEINCLDLIIQKNPDNIDHYKERAMAYWNNNQQEKAIEDFNTVLASDPNNVEMLHKRALANIDIGNYKEACIDLKKAKKLKYKRSAIAYKENCNCIPKKNNKITTRKLRIS